MPTARYGTGAVHVPAIGDVVLGGTERHNDCGPYLRTVEILLNGSMGEELNQTWQPITPMLKPRFSPSAVYFDNTVYVTSGGDSVESISLGTIQWTLISECPTLDASPYSMEVFNGSVLLSCRYQGFIKF